VEQVGGSPERGTYEIDGGPSGFLVDFIASSRGVAPSCSVSGTLRRHQYLINRSFSLVSLTGSGLVCMVAGGLERERDCSLGGSNIDLGAEPGNRTHRRAPLGPLDSRARCSERDETGLVATEASYLLTSDITSECSASSRS
jgi:hypothetical protein